MSCHLLKVFTLRSALCCLLSVPHPDPPDELVVLAPHLLRQPNFTPSQSCSLLMRWKAVMCGSGLHCARLGLAAIAGIYILHY